jgi:hypothetical protein
MSKNPYDHKMIYKPEEIQPTNCGSGGSGADNEKRANVHRNHKIISVSVNSATEAVTANDYHTRYKQNVSTLSLGSMFGYIIAGVFFAVVGIVMFAVGVLGTIAACGNGCSDDCRNLNGFPGAFLGVSCVVGGIALFGYGINICPKQK